MACTEPVGGPFPDVADHVVEPMVVGGKRSDRGRALIAVLRQVLPGKLTLPSVGHYLAAGMELIAPSEFGTLLLATRGKFPFRFGGQIFASPARVGERVLVGDVHHWMIADT